MATKNASGKRKRADPGAPGTRKKLLARAEKSRRRKETRLALSRVHLLLPPGRKLDRIGVLNAAASASARKAIAVTRALRLARCPWMQDAESRVELETEKDVTAAVVRREKGLRRFFDEANNASMQRSTIDSNVATLYAGDKFEDRADEMCRALLHGWLGGESVDARCDDGSSVKGEQAGAGHRLQAALRAAVAAGDGTLRVASIGGGPGNDAVGFLLFNALALRAPRCEATVYDFADSWRPICGAVHAALCSSPAAALVSEDTALPATALAGANASEGADVPSETTPRKLSLRFSLCDLQAPAEAPSNAALLAAAASGESRVFLFSYCCYEARAHEHPLLPRILRDCAAGSVLVFLDMRERDVDRVRALASTLGPGSSFHARRLGSRRNFPFKGLLLVKADAASGGDGQRASAARESGRGAA